MNMATIHFRSRTTSTLEQFIAALPTSAEGSQVFNKSADDYLKVYSRGATDADVTEGSGGVWERLHYDWSDPNRVIIRTTDSNVWSGHSGHTYTLPAIPTAPPTWTSLSSSARQERQGRDATTTQSGSGDAARSSSTHLEQRPQAVQGFGTAARTLGEVEHQRYDRNGAPDLREGLPSGCSPT